jgi:hypothetical protein
MSTHIYFGEYIQTKDINMSVLLNCLTADTIALTLSLTELTSVAVTM